MSAARTVRVTIELPAHEALTEGLLRAMEDAQLRGDGTVTVPGVHLYSGARLFRGIGTWELIEVTDG